MKSVRCDLWMAFLDFEGQFVVDVVGKSGGLMMLWKKSINNQIKSFSTGHIDCVVRDKDSLWRFTGLYGNVDVSQRTHSWSLLRRLGADNNINHLSWLVGVILTRSFMVLRSKGDKPDPIQKWKSLGGQFKTAASMMFNPMEPI